MDLRSSAAHPLRALVALDGSPFAEAALIPAAHLVAALAPPGKGALHKEPIWFEYDEIEVVASPLVALQASD